MPPSDVVHADDLQNSRIETIFYITLILTVLLAYFFIRELVTMLIGIKLATESAVPPDLITAYLAFLLGYTGWKQFRKWAEFRNGTGEDDSQVVVSVILAGHGLIPRMPPEKPQNTGFHSPKNMVLRLRILLWLSRTKCAQIRTKCARPCAYCIK